LNEAHRNFASGIAGIQVRESVKKELRLWLRRQEFDEEKKV
jgi:hypothetical protein